MYIVTPLCVVFEIGATLPCVQSTCTNLVYTADIMLGSGQLRQHCPHVHLEYLYNAHVLYLGYQFGLKSLLLVEEWGCIVFRLPSALLDLMQCCLR